MNEPSVFQQSPTPPPVQRTSNRKRSIIIFLIILILLIAGLAALYIIGGNTKRPPTVAVTPAPTQEPVMTAVPTATTSATPTASPAAALDRTAIRVSVQNGSGTPGAAQKYATALQTAGYTKVTSGNAESFDHTGVTIIVTKKFNSYLPLLQKDLTATAGSAKILTSVDDTIDSDAQVIVGK